MFINLSSSRLSAGFSLHTNHFFAHRTFDRFKNYCYEQLMRFFYPHLIVMHVKR